MYREPENITFAYIDAFVDELARSGVRNVVVSPGSRSTPLAYAFARNEAIKVWMNLDERSAAFFGLGMAKASRSPVALVCTSGTAAANYFPAVVEAHISRVPLIVLTADRPPELRDNGAPQAINQINLYGNYAKWFQDVALPEATNEALRYIRTIAGRAFGTAIAKPSGPVHLNFPFREPLTPTAIPGQAMPSQENRDPVAWRGRPNNQPYVSLSQSGRRLSKERLQKLAEGLNLKGVIICGVLDEPGFAEEVTELACKLNYPILADPLSGLRTGSHNKSLVIDNYDAFLRDETACQLLKPELIIRFGAMPTAKPLLLWLKRYPDCRQIVVDGGDGWQEPTELASEIIYADPRRLCQDLAAIIGSGTSQLSDWAELWQNLSQITARVISAKMAEIDEPFEGKVFAELGELLPDGASLFVGNSMPVRDLDTFFPNNERGIHILCNRGANGIDGVVSSALGAGAVSKGPLVLVIGDVSFYHDMNGLLAAKMHQLNATIILLNNDGGGIFSFLPQSGFPDNFEQLFGTPHGLDFRPTAELYGASYSRIENWPDFRQNVSQSLNRAGLKIIEMPTQRDRNVTLHRLFWPAIAEAIKVEGREGVLA